MSSRLQLLLCCMPSATLTMHTVLQVMTADGAQLATGIKPKDPTVHDGTMMSDAMLHEDSQGHPAGNIADGVSASAQVCHFSCHFSCKGRMWSTC